MLPSLTCRSLCFLKDTSSSQKALASQKRSSCRRFSTLNIKSLPHHFGLKEALERFKKIDSTRFFQAKFGRNSFLKINAADASSLKQVFVPFYGYRVFIAETEFTAQVGFERSTTSYRLGSHYRENRIEWKDVCGRIPFFTYPEIGIYAGLRWERQSVEDAFDLVSIEKQSYQSFSSSQIDLSIEIDPLKKRQKMADKLFKERLQRLEKERLEAYLKQKFTTSFVHVQHLTPHYTCLKPNVYMLPGFVLDQHSHASRIMSAQDATLRVSGSMPLSVPKIFLGISTMTTLMTSLWPEISFGAQMASALTFAFSGALGAKLKDSLAERAIRQKIAADERENLSFEELPEDRLRQQATLRKIDADHKRIESENLLTVDAEHYEALGLSKGQPLTLEIVREAFFRKMQENYSSKCSDSGDECRRLLKARRVFYHALNEIENQ